MGITKLPVYVVNLKEREDRWRRFESQPVTSLFSNLHRFNAVNGKKLKYKRDKRISMRTRLNITRNYRRSHHEIATLGAIGSSLSHIGIWKKFVATGKPVCVVFEDDVILTNNQLQNIDKHMENLPTSWGVWILGCYMPNLIIEPISHKPWCKVHNFTGAHAYMITREAAKTMLEEPFPIEAHIEHYMTTVGILKDIHIVHNDNVHLEFFRKPDSPRTSDSNTSQHKKNGCATCDVKDDYKQLYRGFSRKTRKGMQIMGVVDGEQSKDVLTFNNTAAERL